jgi:hypothetical protein
MSEQLRGRWAGQRIPFGEGKLSPGHPARTFAEKAKRDAVRCLRDRHQTSGSSEVLAYAPVCYGVSMYRKLLDQAVEFR